MTLRLRLVLALAALVTVGLAVFGFVTYGLYARSQYDRLDDQVRAAVPLVTRQLFEVAGEDFRPGPGGFPRGGPGGPGGPSLVVAPGTYAQLLGAGGQVLAEIQLSNTDDQPDLPDELASTGSGIFTTGSVTGATDWRVLVSAAQGGPFRVVVAVPTNEVRAALDRLVFIEAASGAGLLALLALGSWLILRRGLRPLEQMAATARTITAGDLTARVEPAGDRSEVGQLGVAINTMLGELEVAFGERDATEQRLRQFLADASHELRTPLTSIQGFAELFRVGGGNEQVDLPIILRRIEEESARMHHLVDDLLLLARVDQTRAPERVPVDASVLAADACSDAVAADPDRRVTLDAPAPVVVLGDQDHLRQAIGNLVGNAVQHTPAGTPIEVSARLDDGRAVVTVRDHGEGLDGEALAHAFDRFWRASASRAGRGAGLGLAIVAAIAAEHSGSVRAANAPGGGAAFTLELPAG